MATKKRLGNALLATVAAALALPLVSGCESDDPCARRQAACVEVTLVGKKDDGNGNPIAYRGLEVKIFAPNMSSPQTGVVDKCDSGHVYGSEMAPSGSMLAATPIPDLTLRDTFSPAIQTKLSFQLPDSFNALDDAVPADIIDPIPDNADKITKLKELRDSDPRAIRMIVTQSGQTKSAWDSRCDEERFSEDEWMMKQYYRVGKNKFIVTLAYMEGAMTSAP